MHHVANCLVLYLARLLALVIEQLNITIHQAIQMTMMMINQLQTEIQDLNCVHSAVGNEVQHI